MFRQIRLSLRLWIAFCKGGINYGFALKMHFHGIIPDCTQFQKIYSKNRKSLEIRKPQLNENFVGLKQIKKVHKLN